MSVLSVCACCLGRVRARGVAVAVRFALARPMIVIVHSCG
jgi:hypothetical protein